MKTSSLSPGHQRTAFSLIELLVSVALLAIVMVVVLSMTNGTASLARRSEARIENSANLRTALDRMGYDIASALKREDLLPQFAQVGDNDTLTFQAAVPGYNGTRQLALIQYRIGSGGLERGAEGFTWDASDSPFSLPPNREVSPENFDIFAPRVFRMSVGFYLSDGTFRNTPPPDDWRDVSAISVCLAAVSEAALTEVGWTSGDAMQLGARFPEPAADKPALASWRRIAQQPATLQSEGVPLPVARGIEVRQRVFPVR